MPSVLRWKGWIFLFYSSDGDEPPHIHIRKDNTEAKFWLQEVKLARNRGVKELDIRALENVVKEYRETFLEQWHEYFG